MTMAWNRLNNGGMNDLGALPDIIVEEDLDDVVAQVNKRYAHGGGWNDFKGFKLNTTGTNGVQMPVDKWTLKYPGDPAYTPKWFAYIRGECVVVFDHSWVVAYQIDSGDWRCCRMD